MFNGRPSKPPVSFFTQIAPTLEKFLIAGLGNPGADYRDTRHNVGFYVLDALAAGQDVSFREGRYANVAAFKAKGRMFVLIKPNTFMNLSGKAISYWLRQEKIPVKHLLVVVDDLALPLASIRIREKGSDGGHNGLKSITEILGHSRYARLRIGIGNDFPPGGQSDYVLSPWTAEEKTLILPACETAAKAILEFGLGGIAAAMNRFNG